MNYMLQWRIGFVMLAVLNLAGLVSSAAESRSLPQGLVQYIQEARRLGVKEKDIKEYALRVGWEPKDVDQALVLLRTPDLSAARDERAATPVGSKPSATSNDAPAGYRIGGGDVLQIIVWKEPDASVPATVVRPDGKIAVPLIKEVEVVGMTPKEAEKVIAAGLSRYIHDADVTVVVSAINSTKVYVVGAAKTEGPIALRYRMTILQVLSEAGGLTDYAKRKKIYLMRVENGKRHLFPFNYDAVIKGEQLEQNIFVMPNDTIVVPH